MNAAPVSTYPVRLVRAVKAATAFLQEQLVDELISYVAPTLLGQSARTMFNAEFSHMAEQLRFKLRDVTRLGDDVRFRLIPFQETL